MLDRKVINVLLADDDDDDRFFFRKVVRNLSFQSKLVTVSDREELTDYLSKNTEHAPDVLFLDINMPRNNGFECLAEIKSDKEIKDFPSGIYSTSLMDTLSEMLYLQGAHFYLRKGSLSDLEKYLQHIFILIEGNNFKRPSKERFLLNKLAV